MFGTAFAASGANTLPWVHVSNASNQVSIATTPTALSVSTGSDRSGWSGIITLEYTKT